ncbi:F-box protein [Thecamonas trahens ATCC 50062]|uniref:F-box protein n=1 Tax=Thecamonas trahens ATCC 50062 TaxID=461836 RepID=A0A0L0DQ72_THETB|nr:F-box protein [Thecamonas trahens ATCC 50062]KNC54452.1 F-box protein [Thecamonas trahens ATCC 50062]|eukprot:XP_013753608.1 F-box protein [Thecamonas trahens ATCC 50062]
MTAIPEHPRGVVPQGNALVPGAAASIRASGLGAFAVFSDSDLLDLLKRLGVWAVGKLAQCSRAMYTYANEEEIWRAVVLADDGLCGFGFVDSWRTTWLTMHASEKISAEYMAEMMAGRGLKAGPWRGLYSDYLAQGWDETIERIKASEVSVEEFVARYDRENVPVVIEGAIEHWPAVAERLWSKDALVERHGATRFACGLADLTLGEYFQYSAATREEVPIYLFDKAFGEKEPGLVDEYEVPEYFGREDFFAELAADVRPRFRWFLIGPARSGSTFHKDPNYTSAWNGLVSGKKKWVLFPPHYTPPGVFPSGDGWDVTAPLSLASWFLNFYADSRSPDAPVQPVLAVQKPGDVLFIPAQWWHTALNLEESIAVTQNYVSQSNLPEVVDFVSRKADTSLYDALRASLDANHPGLVEKIRAEREASGWSKKHFFPMPKDVSPAATAAAAAAAASNGGGSWWNGVTAAAASNAEAGSSFGFTFG